MNLITYMHGKYRDREDKDNMYGVGIDDAVMIDYLVDYLLGEDWRVDDPITHNQLNEIALYDILDKYSPKYRRQYRKWKKLLKRRDRLNDEFFKHFDIVDIPVKGNY